MNESKKKFPHNKNTNKNTQIGLNANITLNWWGPTAINESRVIDRIHDYADSYSSGTTIYFPWLMSPNCSDVGYNATRLPWVSSNNTISGFLYSDLTLNAGNYTVLTTSIVDSGVTLRLQPGVCFYFMEGVSLDIKGTLIANASGSTPICFTAHSSLTPSQWWGRLYFRNGSQFDSNGNYAGGSYLVT